MNIKRVTELRAVVDAIFFEMKDVIVKNEAGEDSTKQEVNEREIPFKIKYKLVKIRGILEKEMEIVAKQADIILKKYPEAKDRESDEFKKDWQDLSEVESSLVFEEGMKLTFDQLGELAEVPSMPRLVAHDILILEEIMKE